LTSTIHCWLLLIIPEVEADNDIKSSGNFLKWLKNNRYRSPEMY